MPELLYKVVEEYGESVTRNTWNRSYRLFLVNALILAN